MSELRALLAGARAVELYGAHGALGAAIAAGLAGAEPTAGPLLYVVADDETAEARAHDLGFFLPHPHATDDPLVAPSVLHLPAPESSPYAELQPDRRGTLARMAALFRLSRGFAPTVLVASAAALFRRVVPRAPFESLCEVITPSLTVDRDGLAARLLKAGFSRAAVVEDAGTFAVRGAVVDLFPPVYRHPIRIELYGDEVESIRLYDATTQRTLRALDAVHIHPVRETVATAGADPRARILAAADAAVFPSTKTRRLLEQIDEGESFFGIDALAPAFHARMAPLFDYLPAGALCVVEDPEAVIEEARRHATPPARDRGVAAGRAPAGAARRRLRPPGGGGGRGAGGAAPARDSAGGDRALSPRRRRAAAGPRRVRAAHDPAGRAAARARRRGAEPPRGHS